MQFHRDNQHFSDENAKTELAMLTVLGDREDQQDSIGCELKPEEGLLVLCDGMGGYSGGKLASSLAVDSFLTAYTRDYPCDDHAAFLERETQRANSRVASLKGRDGKPLNAGSTLVALLISGDQLYWSSVGDSRAYLLRDGEFVQFTLDHTYLTVLNEKRNAGLIGEKEYAREQARGETLISFLGIGQLDLVDYNDRPLLLKKDDRVIVMSDGLYKLVSDEELCRVMNNFSNISEALQALEIKAQKKAKAEKTERDNMTAAIIRVK